MCQKSVGRVCVCVICINDRRARKDRDDPGKWDERRRETPSPKWDVIYGQQSQTLALIYCQPTRHKVWQKAKVKEKEKVSCKWKVSQPASSSFSFPLSGNFNIVSGKSNNKRLIAKLPADFIITTSFLLTLTHKVWLVPSALRY